MFNNQELLKLAYIMHRLANTLEQIAEENPNQLPLPITEAVETETPKAKEKTLEVKKPSEKKAEAPKPKEKSVTELANEVTSLAIELFKIHGRAWVEEIIEDNFGVKKTGQIPPSVENYKKALEVLNAKAKA